jgi:cobalamin biosynthesis protein CbiD
MEFLAKLAHEITGNGSPVCVPRTGSLAKELRHANTARHALEILRHSSSCSDVINEIGRRMTASLKAWLPSDIKVVLETLILDFDGQILFQGAITSC